MELEWTRQVAAQALSVSEIGNLISESSIEPLSAELIEEGLANTNYRLQAAECRSYHLRILQRSPGNLATEVALMKRMEPKMPVPRVLFWSVEPAFLLSEWVPGNSLQRIEASGDRSTAIAVGFQLGQMLAKLRDEHFAEAGFLNSSLCVVDPWPTVYDGLRGFMEFTTASETCRSRAPEELLHRARKAWDRLEPEIRDATSQPCLSHADFKPSNILVDEGRVTALLDWEFAHAGTWLLDAGQVLRYMGDRKRTLADQIELGLIDGGVRPPVSWLAMASTIDTASLCDFLARPVLDEPQLNSTLALLEEELAIAEFLH